ncbi:hypothetical protein BD770DRAFT_373662 [Pilaira anomala]|nr:hypothetical protein BD770DRAFT_373662 [Pilaira anomala]
MVLNSLILSKLWHVLRIISVPSSFFKSVQSIISNFINFRTFPKISFYTACLPRSHGGLGLLNPAVQQSALQVRWLHPLLSTKTSALQTDVLTSDSIVLLQLISFLYSQVALASASLYSVTSPLDLDHRFFFLFPSRRPPNTKQLNSSLALLFKAIDDLPKSYTDVVVSSATCLEIPIGSLIIPSTNLRKSTASLLASSAYTFNGDRNHCLRPKTSVELTHHPILTRSFLKQVSKNEIKLAPFFIRSFIPPALARMGLHPFSPVSDHRVIDIDPFLDRILVAPGTSSQFNAKTYRLLCLKRPGNTNLLLPPPFSPKMSISWSSFWNLPITHSCRNFWYRILHKKIPHKSLLHHLIPVHFPSPACPICSEPVESILHFIFLCPAKLHTWQYMWHTFINPSDPRVSLDQLQLAIYALQTPTRTPDSPQFSAILIVAATLEALWRCHWAFVFNNTPFLSSSVILVATAKVFQMRQEYFISKGIPHAPLPHISTD